MNLICVLLTFDCSDGFDSDDSFDSYPPFPLLLKQDTPKKGAMYRWITEYIEENSTFWEQEKNERQEQENKIIAEWLKKNRFETIKQLRRKSKEKIEQNRQEKLSTEKESMRQIWRTTPMPNVQEEQTKLTNKPKITEK